MIRLYEAHVRKSDSFANCQCSVAADTKDEARAVLDEFVSRIRGDRKVYVRTPPEVEQQTDFMTNSTAWIGYVRFVRCDEEQGDVILSDAAKQVRYLPLPELKKLRKVAR